MIADQALLPPILGFLSFNAQADDTIDFSLNDALVRQHLLVVRPGQNGSARGEVRVPLHTAGSAIRTTPAPTAYNFPTDLPFNPADPRTYPERFSIRVPDQLDYELNANIFEIYGQDKWQVRNGLT